MFIIDGKFHYPYITWGAELRILDGMDAKIAQKSDYKPIFNKIDALSVLLINYKQKTWLYVMTKEHFFEQLKKASLDKHADRFESLLKNTIRIYLSKQKEKKISIGDSKIGGHPDFPKDMNWPTDKEANPLSFIAQINLRDCSHLDSENLLPKTGMLYFFYSAEQTAWGFDPKDEDKFKVIFYDGSLDALQRQKAPKTLKKQDIFYSNELRFVQEVSLPSLRSPLLDFLSESEKDNYFDTFEETPDVNKLLGFADEIQNEMELECELVTNGLYCGDTTGYEDPRAVELGKNKSHWRLLLQIDSNDEANMMWGDVGRLYFWIKKEDLLNKNFEKAWFILQCG